MVNAKHLATFLLGAAAGAAFIKYKTMSEEEQEELMGKFKTKAEEFKTEAKEATGKAEEYFDELKDKGTTAMKDFLDEAEDFLGDIFPEQKKEKTDESQA